MFELVPHGGDCHDVEDEVDAVVDDGTGLKGEEDVVIDRHLPIII